VKIAVVVFPGSNCDHDTEHVVRDVCGQQVSLVWHKDTDLSRPDAVILPGGFAHGDYLRSGAIARFSPIMREVERFAAAGGPVLGICNGFQVLLEAGLLPGAMLRNRSLQFRCEFVRARVEHADTPFTAACREGDVLRMPIAHGDGNYYAEADDVARLEDNRQVIFRYVDATGAASDAGNPNGSVSNIAGICNAARNVVGLMPHPERACELALGSADGLRLFESVMGSGVVGSGVQRHVRDGVGRHTPEATRS
jgi:phosphoribosylformylglycinamidine synthase